MKKIKGGGSVMNPLRSDRRGGKPWRKEKNLNTGGHGSYQNLQEKIKY